MLHRAWSMGKREKLRDRRGAVLIIVMAFLALMVLSTVSLSGMIKQNVELIQRVKLGAQAQYAAEAGLQHAFARFKNENFGSRTNFNGTLDTGRYAVTFSTSGSKYLITSVGTVGDVSKTVSAEVEDLTPSSMRCICSADNDIRLNSFVASASITGDVHANRDVYLKSLPILSSLAVTGTVSATGVVKEGSRLHQTDGFWGGYLDANVYINGQRNDSAIVVEGAPRKRLPTFNLARYKEVAIESGDYYSTDQTFNNQTLSPANGTIYVDGRANFYGDCTINGGIIAKDIYVYGNLTQHKSGTRNLILSMAGGDIAVYRVLETEEAVVYAGRDILSIEIGANVNVSGVLLAKRDIYMWNFVTYIDYNYIETYPADMGDEESQLFGIVSWNR